MNFLAHLYLSGNREPLMIGNFMADHIKGKVIHTLPADIREGVLLHRKIDAYTDTHPVVELSKARLRPEFRKYAPVITDLYFDHFLAADWDRYSTISLNDFAEQFYKTVFQYEEHLPARTIDMVKNYMIPRNWLVNYATVKGISTALAGMSRRTRFDSGMENAGAELSKNYDLYHSEFTLFFAELRNYVGEELRNHHP